MTEADVQRPRFAELHKSDEEPSKDLVSELGNSGF